MTNRKDIDRIADLAGSDPADPPSAKPLTPDVRSGATFPFFDRDDASDDAIAPYLVIWVYSVPVSSREQFAETVEDFELTLGDPPSLTLGDPPSPAEGLSYRGTYSVSVSSAAPDFDFRTVWSLSTLENLQTLNDVIGDPGNTKLQALLQLIEKKPPMRAEILGLTKLTRRTST